MILRSVKLLNSFYILYIFFTNLFTDFFLIDNFIKLIILACMCIDLEIVEYDYQQSGYYNIIRALPSFG